MKMTIGEKIKWMRNDKEMSQAELADALGVSRQAVTKWESDAGIPEVENIISLAKLFGTTVDALVMNDAPCYSSFIQYDIDSHMDFEIESVPAKSFSIEGWDSEKIRVELNSDTITDLDSDLKVTIESRKRKMELAISKKNDLTDTICRKDLSVVVKLPKKFIDCVELKTNVDHLALRGFSAEDTEFDGSADLVCLNDVHGQIEMDMRSDCRFKVFSLDGSLEINQIERISRVEVPADLVFKAVDAGRKCEITITKGLKNTDDSEDVIELNGMKIMMSIEPMDSQ